MSTATRLRARADSFSLQLTGSLEAKFVAYFDLLFRWNARINLTSLTDPDAAIDRLLLEPLAAARELERPATPSSVRNQPPSCSPPPPPVWS